MTNVGSWKEVQPGTWLNMNTRRLKIVRIQDNRDGDLGKNKGNWRVVVSIPSGDTSRYFKTKEQARSWSISWMRQHPKG